MAKGAGTLRKIDLTGIKDTKAPRFLMAIRLGETIDVNGGYKTTDGGNHLLTGNRRRKCGVYGFRLDQNRDRALRIVGEESVRGGFAIDEAEVGAVAGVLAARSTVADGSRL